MNSESWDKRYNPANGFLYGTLPNDFVAAQAHLLPPNSRILSIGEGEGRNAVHLAKMGHSVHCIDLSKVGLEKAVALAKENNVASSLITTQVVDLATVETLGTHTYDAVLSIWCHLPSSLEKRVVQLVAAALKPRSGLFILEHYTPKNVGRGTGGPQDADLCIDPVVLKSLVEENGLKVVFLGDVEREVSEGFHQGLSATVQLIAQQK
ncbi:SAM domain-containing protein [Obelidium mucronatum]|nr:SAM domain-containing protein [Obelidium mucronatum]